MTTDDLLADLELSGPLEAAAKSYADDPDTRITVDRTLEDTWLQCGRECPKMRLKLTLDLKCLDDSPDEVDHALIMALEDFCERAKRRLGENRGPSCSHCSTMAPVEK